MAVTCNKCGAVNNYSTGTCYKCGNKIDTTTAGMTGLNANNTFTQSNSNPYASGQNTGQSNPNGNPFVYNPNDAQQITYGRPKEKKLRFNQVVTAIYLLAGIAEIFAALGGIAMCFSGAVITGLIDFIVSVAFAVLYFKVRRNLLDQTRQGYKMISVFNIIQVIYFGGMTLLSLLVTIAGIGDGKAGFGIGALLMSSVFLAFSIFTLIYYIKNKSEFKY